MFLLAKLICENLYEQANIDDLNTELQPNTFPQEIDEALVEPPFLKYLNFDLQLTKSRYGRIMVRLSSQMPSKGKTDYCLLLLSWLVCAKRPLKWYEIQTARSIDLEEHTVNLNRYSFRDGPKDICGSLVEEDDVNGTVELVHLTAKQSVFISPQTPHVTPRGDKETHLNPSSKFKVPYPERVRESIYRGDQIHNDMCELSKSSGISTSACGP